MTGGSPHVSRETQDKLARYAALLRKWQARINLVAPDTLDVAEHRHFDDSLQILPFLPEKKEDRSGPVLVDFGSGAGFPGLALAIARPDLQVHLVESDAKKCEFLKTVSRETETPVTVQISRIEALAPFNADVITARALAPLAKLIAFSMPFVILNPLIKLIFLKGGNWADEVAAARDIYDFNLTDIPSTTHPKARLLIIKDLSPRA